MEQTRQDKIFIQRIMHSIEIWKSHCTAGMNCLINIWRNNEIKKIIVPANE